MRGAATSNALPLTWRGEKPCGISPTLYNKMTPDLEFTLLVCINESHVTCICAYYFCYCLTVQGLSKRHHEVNQSIKCPKRSGTEGSTAVRCSAVFIDNHKLDMLHLFWIFCPNVSNIRNEYHLKKTFSYFVTQSHWLQNNCRSHLGYLETYIICIV